MRFVYFGLWHRVEHSSPLVGGGWLSMVFIFEQRANAGTTYRPFIVVVSSHGNVKRSSRMKGSHPLPGVPLFGRPGVDVVCLKNQNTCSKALMHMTTVRLYVETTQESKQTCKKKVLENREN